jgi:hypothetical protein
MSHLLFQKLLYAFGYIDFGQRFAVSVTYWVNVFAFWYFQHLGIQRVEDHQCKGKREGAAIDAVYQDALRHDNSIRLQPQGKVGIGHVSAFAKFFNELFSLSLVKLTGLHLYKSCIEINAQILKAIRTLNTHASKLMHAYKSVPFTARQTRQVLNKRSP